MILIGIDPDIEKNGVCIVRNCNITERLTMQLYNMNFTQLVGMLKAIQNEYKERLTVFIECGYLNKGNWHLGKDKARYAGKIGEKVGANHQISKLLVEFCKEMKIDYRQIQPKKKKVTHKEFVQLSKFNYSRTNQEQRDAAMLVLRSPEYLTVKNIYRDKETSNDFEQLSIW